MLKFALWVQVTFCPCVTLDLWHCKLSLHIWEEKRQTDKGWNTVSAASFLSSVSFCQYIICSQRNLQAIKHIRTWAAFARNWTKYSAGAHFPGWSVAPVHGSICRNLLLILCLPVQVSTLLGLFQQLRAARRNNPSPSPALDQGLHALHRKLWHFPVLQQTHLEFFLECSNPIQLAQGQTSSKVAWPGE